MLNLIEGNFGSPGAFRFIEEKLGAGAWIWNIESGDMDWSRGFFELVGLEPRPEKPSFADIQRMIHPEDRLSAAEIVESLRNGVPVEREYRIVRPNGRVRWLSSWIEIIIPPDGRADRAIGVSRDVTKQRELLQQSRQAANRYDALVNSIDERAWIVDNSGGIIRALKTDDADNDSSQWLDRVSPEDRDTVAQSHFHIGAPPKRHVFLHRMNRLDGTSRWTRTTAAPVHDDRLRTQEWLYVSKDVDLERRYLPATTDDPQQLTGAQVRAARGILAVSVKELADAAQISPAKIRRYEETEGPNPPEDALAKLRATLVEAGIEFVFTLEGEPGVRPLRRRTLGLHRQYSHK